MKAMIMAAGVGSRLMPLTTRVPKPMIPMANVPLMESIVTLLHTHGYDDLICNLHYHADNISSYFGDGNKFDVSMTYSQEDELMGTAGGVKNCEWFLEDTFVVISGDALTDIDLGQLLAAHRKQGALASIALKEVDEVEHFGVVITDEDGKIKRFQEKPRPEEALSHNANTGIYVFEPEIFKYIPTRQFYDFGKQVFPHLVKMGAPFYGVPVKDYWCDVGNISTYCQAHSDILQQRVKTNTAGKIIKTAEGSRVLLGEGVTCGNNVRFEGNVVIGSGCHIGNNAYISNSVVWENTAIGDKTIIKEAVIGSGSTLGQGVKLNPGAVVAEGCILPDRVEVPAGGKVFYTVGNELHLEQG
jgi:mannose-1-phosphate guanylyltransferase